MGRQPGETTEQWCDRACAEYVEAWEALEAEQRLVNHADDEHSETANELWRQVRAAVEAN